MSAASSPTRSPRRIGCSASMRAGTGHRRARTAGPPVSGGSAIRLDHVGFTYPGTPARGALRFQPRHRAGGDRGAGRAVRLGQDDARQSAAALLGSGHAARSRSTAPTCANTSSTTCAAASRSSRRTPISSTTRLRDNVRLARPDADEAEIVRGARARGARASSSRACPKRLDTKRRRARRAALRRPASARRHRPRVPQERAGADPRRSDLASRRASARRRSAHALDDADARPHDHRDRASPVDGPRRSI